MFSLLNYSVTLVFPVPFPPRIAPVMLAARGRVALLASIFCVSLVAVLCTATSASQTSSPSSSRRKKKQSNLVLILTDDQDLEFDSLRAMKFTSDFLGARGAQFENFFAHTPVCCPSRGELLTGRYLHNQRPASAEDESCMRLRVDDEFYSASFVNDLKSAGYRTLMSGKYLNGDGHCMCPEAAGGKAVAWPSGWDRVSFV